MEAFHTHPENGLSTGSLASIQAQYGPNEFELPPSESLYIKFAKQVYENPLILLLLGSSGVSALMGQYDDAVCVIIAVSIVLTGESKLLGWEKEEVLIIGSGFRARAAE